MANDLNLCQFIGRLGKDPEQRFMPNGDAVCNFSLAVGWKTKDKEGVEWVDCVAFRKPAEIITEYCAKGSQLYVAGKFRTRKWQDRDGKDRYSPEIVVENFQFIGSKGEGRPSGESRPQANSRSEEPPFNPSDDIPF